MLHIVVACNGCVDDTAAIARQHGADVVETGIPSKTAALNAGDDAAAVFPRLYIDADVTLSATTVADLVRAFADPGVLCAAPPFRIELQHCHWLVRTYYAIWLRLPYLRDAYVGSGIYALSAAGRARFDKFPAIIADDLFIRNLFSRSERRIVTTEPFVIRAPRTLSALYRRRVRINVGNLELLSHPEWGRLQGSAESSAPWWLVPLKKPHLIPAAIVYAAINLVALVEARWRLARRTRVDWARDNTTRSPAK